MASFDPQDQTRKTSPDPGILAQMRHDIKTPLNAVMGLTYLISTTFAAASPKEKQMLETLKSSANDLQSRINALFDLLGSRPAAEMPVEKRVAATDTPHRILLVEDYEPNAIVATTFLENLGYVTELAKDGKEAIEKFNSRQFEAVVMDIQLPDMDGTEIARRIRTQETGAGKDRTPILALTANATEDDRLFCQRAGMDDYLSKPFRMEELGQKLQQLLHTNSTPPRVGHS